MSEPAAVEFRGVHKRYGALHVLRGIELSVPQGQICALIGPSGSGKSTLLRCVNQLEGVSAGRVYLEGELLGYEAAGGVLYPLTPAAIAAQRRRTGMVFQRFNLFPHRTALQNVIEGLVAVKGVPRRDAERRGRALLDRVGLADRAGDHPSRLSGGQQQRVAIARALAMEPRVMLLDEPTSALDPELVGEVLDVIRDVARSGMTMLIVTHEIGFAREVAHRIVFLDGGMLIEDGAPIDVIERPSNARTQAFLSRMR